MYIYYTYVHTTLAVAQVGFEHVEQRSLSLHVDKEKYFRELSRKHQDELKEIGRDIITMVSPALHVHVHVHR